MQLPEWIHCYSFGFGMTELIHTFINNYQTNNNKNNINLNTNNNIFIESLIVLTLSAAEIVS